MRYEALQMPKRAILTGKRIPNMKIRVSMHKTYNHDALFCRTVLSEALFISKDCTDRIHSNLIHYANSMEKIP